MARTRTLEQINRQIEQLRREAQAVRDREVTAVVQRIREAVQHYGITAADLFPGGTRRGSRAAAKTAPTGQTRKRLTAPAHRGRAREVRYRDAAGNTWCGLGKRPTWVREALAGGKTLDDLKA